MDIIGTLEKSDFFLKKFLAYGCAINAADKNAGDFTFPGVLKR